MRDTMEIWSLGGRNKIMDEDTYFDLFFHDLLEFTHHAGEKVAISRPGKLDTCRV